MIQEIARDIYSRQQEMLELLRRLVLIQSGSHNKAGLDSMAESMSGIFSGLGMQSEVISFAHCGNMVIAGTPAAKKQKGILLAGHMDTVFPEDTSFNYFREDESNAYGPGVLDMKGGLVVAVFALKALANAGYLQDLPITVLCNSDEEVGSPYSRKLIESLCSRNNQALVLEGGGLQDQVVVGRKGKIGLQVHVSGPGGHAGNYSGGDKPSAVLEAAHKVIALEDLNSWPRVQVNVGRVDGGTRPNCIAEQAFLEVDIRFEKASDEKALSDKISVILETPVVQGTGCTWKTVSCRPSMPEGGSGEILYDLASTAAGELGFSVGREVRGGVSDANFIAAMGVPVLDGLGPVGDHDHSHREYIIKDSLPRRCALTAACILMALGQSRGVQQD
ncbi:M20 family metallopeptidase [Desulfonatronospira sp.]|uniref:M20 family metallopeptidase n=1 Tax=Desulfonatronospira sp. TaxID=1962951 RepID=UPI0025B8AF1B|nr:M20 family metallopeptidase [Desulfonatronospira sp.]